MIRLNLGHQSHDIEVLDADSGFGNFVAERSKGRTAFIVADENTASYAEPIRHQLNQAGFKCRLESVPPGEGSKCLAAAAYLYDHLAWMPADRSTVVVSVGGGVVGVTRLALAVAGAVAADAVDAVPVGAGGVGAAARAVVALVDALRAEIAERGVAAAVLVDGIRAAGARLHDAGLAALVRRLAVEAARAVAVVGAAGTGVLVAADAVFALETLLAGPRGARVADPDQRLRGIVVHDIMSRFAKAFPDRLPNDPYAKLMGIAREVLSDYDRHPRVAAFWQRRFERFAG